MARTAVVALAFLAFMAGSAQATTFQVVVVPGLTLDDLEEFADRGAVGLLNPGAGGDEPQVGDARPRHRRGPQLAEGRWPRSPCR